MELDPECVRKHRRNEVSGRESHAGRLKKAGLEGLLEEKKSTTKDP